MGKQGSAAKPVSPAPARSSALIDTRVIYCGDCLEQLKNLPPACVDLIYISQIRRGGNPPFNSNRNYEVFWGETKEKRAFEDRHASTQAYIEYMRPRCGQRSGRLRRSGQGCIVSAGLSRAFRIPSHQRWAVANKPQ
jgi:DNA modification methylase